MSVNFFGDIPGLRLHITARTATVAMGATATHSLFRAPFDLDILAARFVADAAMTGDNTNSKIVELRNEGTDGTGAVAVAAADTFGTGDNLVAQSPRAFTLSATAADLELDAGEVLSAVITELAAGIAWPAGCWDIVARVRGGS